MGISPTIRSPALEKKKPPVRSLRLNRESVPLPDVKGVLDHRCYGTGIGNEGAGAGDNPDEEEPGMIGHDFRGRNQCEGGAQAHTY